MRERTPTLMADIERAGRDGMVHLWAAIVGAVVSLLLPFGGFVAAYSGYRLSTIMDRAWFGLLFAGYGLVIALSWAVLLVAA